MKSRLSATSPEIEPAEAIAGWPDADSIAALRAWYSGLSSRQAVERYLSGTIGEGQSARGVLGAVRRQVAAFARSRHRNEWVELLTHPESERRARSKSVLRVLELLPGLPPPEPLIADEVAQWFSARISRVLTEQGIRTLSDLTVRVPRRRQWWRAVQGLGQTSARQIEAFFAAHPKLTERARALIVATERSPIVPWEVLQVPDAVDGSRGTFRAPRDTCTLDASNDYEAVQAWLSLHESAATQRAYRKEAERLILWAIVERQRALSSLTTEDAVAYRNFLRRPTPASRWVGPPKARRTAGWRPFNGGLSARSIAYALNVIGALFRWLIEQRYVLANPFSGLKVRGAGRASPVDSSRAFSDDEWALIRTIANGLEWSHGWSAGAAQRVRFVLDFGYSTGLRLNEMVTAKLGDIEVTGDTDWWLHLIGKGGKVAKVVIPPSARAAIDLALAQRGLPTSPVLWDRRTPLLCSVGDAGGITGSRLWAILRRFFALLADLLAKDLPALADKLRHASPHWMRHTHASHALARGAELTTVRDNLRHASISTTSTYLHGDDRKRARQLALAFG